MHPNRRILVVDDEQAICESCRRIFGEHGYDVETAATVKEGLECIRRGYFDCALIDLKMPDSNGMEIVRSARRHRQNMPILIITGYGDMDTAAEATRLGVSDYIQKPFTPQELVDAVKRALQRRPNIPASETFGQLVEKINETIPKPELYENRSPQALAQMVTKKVGVAKVSTSILNMIILGILAGAYIGFGAALATLVGHDAAAKVGVGIAQIIIGGVFSVGLMLVVIAGAELFTGNNLMLASVLGREFSWRRMLNCWAIVYLANFVGALLLAFIMYKSDLWKMAAHGVGAKAVAIAQAKVNLTFSEAFFRGIGCNWLVCLAVWMALSAKEIAGKILAIFFPIMAFVALGYEHCVANMYFIPMGLFLKGTAAAAAANLTGDALLSLTWSKFFLANLIPVTLGNIVGGAIFVGSVYWLVYMRAEQQIKHVADSTLFKNPQATM